MLTPIPFRSFGAGLNLRDKADAVSEESAIDCMNVEFTELGAVKQRGGYTVWTATPLDGQGDTVYPHYESDGTAHLLVGDTATGQLTALLGSDGTEQDIEAGLTAGGCYDFQRFGAPGTEYTYIGNGVDELWYYNGTAFTNVPDSGGSAPPKGGALALMPASNRLVNSRFPSSGGPAGAATYPSTVWFSDAGDPTTWGANNYIHLEPGDGESIQALVNWREFLFVFKETKFYVFYGESIDSEGNPIFNYRVVNTGHGAIGPRAVDVDEFGVYFWDRSGGLMRTTGGEPEYLAEMIAPIYEGGVSPYFLGGTLDWSVASLIAVNVHDERVYINYSAGGTANDRTLVYDPHDGWWSLWDIAAADMVSFHTSATAQDLLYFTYPTGDNQVARMELDDTSDAGTRILSRWRSGWFDIGSPVVKRLRETKLWGVGTVTVNYSGDYEFGATNTDTITFNDTSTATEWDASTWGGGTWAAGAVLDPKMSRKALRATTFSLGFYNETLDQEWAVHRLQYHIASERIPSTRKTDT